MTSTGDLTSANLASDVVGLLDDLAGCPLYASGHRLAGVPENAAPRPSIASPTAPAAGRWSEGGWSDVPRAASVWPTSYRCKER
jgi:hypothetical protein